MSYIKTEQNARHVVGICGNLVTISHYYLSVLSPIICFGLMGLLLHAYCV